MSQRFGLSSTLGLPAPAVGEPAEAEVPNSGGGNYRHNAYQSAPGGSGGLGSCTASNWPGLAAVQRSLRDVS
jgi:hypothetical protein